MIDRSCHLRRHHHHHQCHFSFINHTKHAFDKLSAEDVGCQQKSPLTKSKHLRDTAWLAAFNLIRASNTKNRPSNVRRQDSFPDWPPLTPFSSKRVSFLLSTNWFTLLTHHHHNIGDTISLSYFDVWAIIIITNTLFNHHHQTTAGRRVLVVGVVGWWFASLDGDTVLTLVVCVCCRWWCADRAVVMLVSWWVVVVVKESGLNRSPWMRSKSGCVTQSIDLSFSGAFHTHIQLYSAELVARKLFNGSGGGNGKKTW